MTRATPSMRLKVKADTFFLPDSNGGVYFRNNEGSFHMEGKSIYEWVETLIPALNGQTSLGELTDGLPEAYIHQVYKLADALLTNGIVRDVSQDTPYQLSPDVMTQYANQIEFLDHMAGSGAYRFQKYRQTKVLAVGAGSLLVSLVAALLESGHPTPHVLVTDESSTNRTRMEQLASRARQSDPHVNLTFAPTPMRHPMSWSDIIQGFDAVLYASETEDLNLPQTLNTVCREQGSLFIPATCLHQTGIAGPLVTPNSQGCFESACRRIQSAAVEKEPTNHSFSPIAGALLANVAVFECLKAAADVPVEADGKVFLLNLETLEGSWHSFIPHPAVSGVATPNVLDSSCDASPKSDMSALLTLFDSITSPITGVFCTWEEGDLTQLPLAQCRVTVSDPLASPHASTLPEIICNGLTHEEVRRESGLRGTEAYIARLMEPAELTSHDPELQAAKHCVGIGAGMTVAEGVCRGLQKVLEAALDIQSTPVVYEIANPDVQDERCQFYLQSLTLAGTTLAGTQPVLAFGQDIHGFPSVWVNAGKVWYGGTGLNNTLALRRALERALLVAQNKSSVDVPGLNLAVSSVQREANSKPSQFFNVEAIDYDALLESAQQTLNAAGKNLAVFDVTLEPFLKEALAGVFAVLVREEASR